MTGIARWLIIILLIILVFQAFSTSIISLIEDPGCSVTYCSSFYVGDLRWQAFGKAEHYSSKNTPLPLTLTVEIICRSPYLGIIICRNKAIVSGMGKVNATCYCTPAGEAAFCTVFCSCTDE